MPTFTFTSPQGNEYDVGGPPQLDPRRRALVNAVLSRSGSPDQQLQPVQ